MTQIIITLLSLTLILSSCASILSKSSYPITIKSTPSKSKISIINKKGFEIYTGKTPASLELSAGNGFFSKASYSVRFEKEGYSTKIVPINFKIDSWYFGNILFGGVIGLLIVDPATGAMYKLDTEFINETLIESDKTVDNFTIYDFEEIPNDWKNHLVKLDNYENNNK